MNLQDIKFLQVYYFFMQRKIKNLQYKYSFLLLIIPIFIFSQKNQSSFETKFLDIIYANDLPGKSYSIIKNGKVIKSKNLGKADIKNKRKSKINTNYRLASVTKQFTATTILMLIDDKKLLFQQL